MCFCGGFYEKRVFGLWFFAGDFVVDRGESWLVDRHFLGLKNMPRILDLFFGIPVLGIAVALLGAQFNLSSRIVPLCFWVHRRSAWSPEPTDSGSCQKERDQVSLQQNRNWIERTFMSMTLLFG